MDFGLDPDAFALLERNLEVSRGFGQNLEFNYIIIDLQGDLHGNFGFCEFVKSTGELSEYVVARLKPVIVRSLTIVEN